MTTALLDCRCPACLKDLSAHTDPTDSDPNARPCAGDWSICIECGEILRFSAQLKLVLAQPEHLEALPAGAKTQLIQARDIIRGVGRTRH